MPKTLLIDNYDSFTFNLYQYLGELGATPKVAYNNRISILEIESMRPSHIIVSPGPGRPENLEDFGICLRVIQKIGPKIPILGVCLGHQGIIHAFGGRIITAPEIMHGKKSLINHDVEGIFKGVEKPFKAMRYHSLIGSNNNFPSDELKITARVLNENTIMGVQHHRHPIHGIQFHPESIGTPEGKKILRNFLQI